MHQINNARADEITSIPLLRYSYAFNLSQTSLYDANKLHENITSAEELIAQMHNLPRVVNNYRRCAYNLIDDYVTIPVIENFAAPEEYYSSLFHELIHATGHPNRLNRISIHDDKDKNSEEELIAELGSTYLCAMCGISNSVLENQAAYLQGWMSKLKHDPAILIRASVHAKKAVEYLLPFISCGS